MARHVLARQPLHAHQVQDALRHGFVDSERVHRRDELLVQLRRPHHSWFFQRGRILVALLVRFCFSVQITAWGQFDSGGVVVARGCFARALLPGFLAGAVRAPGAAVGARRGAAFSSHRVPVPRGRLLVRAARAFERPLRRGVRVARPRAGAVGAPVAALLAHDVLPDVAQLLDAHGLEQIVHGAVDDPAQHHVRGAVGAHHHHRHIELERDVLQQLEPVHVGHVHVREHDVEVVAPLAQRFKRRRAAREGGHCLFYFLTRCGVSAWRRRDE